MLYCDEAHNISEIVLDWVGVTITAKDREEWDLPEFPELDSTSGGGILIHHGPDPIEIAILWLEKAFAIMAIHCEKLEIASSASAKQREAYTKADRLCRKLDNVLVSIDQCNDDWFILAGKQARMYRGKPEPGFICRPLTAKHHAPIYFTGGGFKTVMMSATIGNPKAFGGELGLKHWQFRAVPNQWSPEQRRVLLLDVPKLGHTSKEIDYQRQADAIANAIKQVNPAWSGFVHITRKREASLLAERLARRGLQNRVWVPPGADGRYVATDKQLAAWEDRKKRVAGSVCIAWSMWEGIDGLDEKICIVAKIPFGSLGDPYERARLQYSGKMYLQRAAWQLEQGLGRTRRGREQDYDTPDEQRGLVAIADGNWKRVQKYLSQSMRESLLDHR
jgi:Rad3-related DNA helicase